MNLKELTNWAKVNMEKTNADLIAIGVSEKDFHKVRTFSREIVNISTSITLNTQKNDKAFNQIQEYLGYLGQRKLKYVENAPVKTTSSV